MKKLIVSSLMLLGCLTQSLAQQQFIVKGKIEYERKVNLYKEIESFSDGDDDNNSNSWIDQLKKTLPQFELSYFDLYFDEGKSLYKPGRELATQKIPDWFEGPASNNVIYSDLPAKLLTSQKSVYENTYLLQDSARKIDWRITADTRTIAGFECRKAVGRIMDSVYVIAFYTQEIVTNSGPESFGGLPGMILGVAIPRINTTWFATKLEVVPVKPEDLIPPKKGKKTTIPELQKVLQTRMKEWGKYGQRNIWNILL